MKVKKLISLMLAGTMTLGMLTGCGGSGTADNSGAAAGDAAKAGDSAGGVQISFWNPFTGDDGKTMSAIVEQFNQENGEGITVTVQTMAQDDYYAKLPVTISSGTDVPDVAILHIERLPYYSKKELVQEMDADIAEMGLTNDDFISATWNASVQSDGKRYSVPLDTHPNVMFYNRAILTELGYTEDDLNGLDGVKFLEMCEKAKENGYYGIGFYYPSMSSVFYSMLKQFGGNLIAADDPTKAAFNNEAGVKAAEWVRDLLDAGYATNVAGDHVSVFKQGKSLFCDDGIWSSAGMAAIDGLDWGEMFLPQVGETGAVWASSHQLCLMTQKNPDEAKRAAAVTFIKYLSDHSVEWAKAGQVAARIDVLKDPAFGELPWAFAADQLEWFSYMPTEVTAGCFTDAINPVLVDYYNGVLTDTQAALDTAAKNGEDQAKLLLEE